MFRLLTPVVALAALGLLWPREVAAQDPPPAAQWVPGEAVLSLELTRPEAVLDLLLDEEITDFVTGLPVWQELEASGKLGEFQNIVNYVEFSVGTDWRDILARATGGGITLAVGPDGTVVLMVDAADEHIVAKLHEFFLEAARGEATKAGEPDRVRSEQHGDVEVWSFDGKEAHAILGKRFVLSNRPEGLRAVLELREGTREGNLATKASYQAATKAVGPDAALRVYVDLDTLKQAPDVARALEQGRQNPMVALLLAGVVDSLRESTWLASGLHVERDELVLRALTDAGPTGSASPAAFALPTAPGDGPRPNLEVPNRIAAFSAWRDLHRFYAAKDELFPERSSGLIFFENMMGIFFSGRDLTDEVLAEMRPEIRLVVAEQTYDPAIGTPQVRFPGFAAVLGLRHPDMFGEVVEEGWQKALGLINFTRGQEALPGLIIDRGVQGDTEFTVAYFSTSAPDVEDRAHLPQRFNIRPSVAMPGEYLILSSTEGLARDLIDALGEEAATNVSRLEVDTLLELDGAHLASIVEANRESMVRNNMLEEGNTRKEAETAIELLATVTRLVESLELGVGSHEGLLQARLAIRPSWTGAGSSEASSGGAGR